MKRIVFFCIAVFMIGVGFQPAIGQNFVPPMERISEDSSKVVLGINASSVEQFPTGGYELTAQHQDIYDDNKQQLAELFGGSRRMIVYGLQDKQGDYIYGLGDRRADVVARYINDEVLMRDGLPLIETQGVALDNVSRTRILNGTQEYLDSRSVLIVAMKPMEAKHDSDTMEDMQQKIALLENWIWENFWWLLGFPLVLALVGLLLWLLFGGRNQHQTTANNGVNNRPVGNNSDDARNRDGLDEPNGAGESDDNDEPDDADEPVAHPVAHDDSGVNNVFRGGVHMHFHGSHHLNG